MTDLEGREIIYIGKAIERLDLFIRLGYPQEDIQRAFDYLAERLYPTQVRTRLLFNEETYTELQTALENVLINNCKNDIGRTKILSCIENLIDWN